ncbi:MAG: ATP-binding protein [Ginsengibacter sp.]
MTITDRIADKVRWGYLLAFLLLLSSYILTFYTTQKLIKQANWITETHTYINKLDKLFYSLKDAVSSFRGYLLSKDEKFVDQVNQDIAIIKTSFADLERLEVTHEDHGEKLEKLKVAVLGKINFISGSIHSIKSAGYKLTDTLKYINSQGRIRMDTIEQMVTQLQALDKQSMIDRSGRVESFSNFIKIINIASLIVAVLLTFYSIVTYTKENNAKMQSINNANAFRDQLEMRITELDGVNKELVELKSIEKFAATGRISRTIAHEVRNPLTNINLATEHLHTEFEGNPETDLLLDMITRNANRINQMISELLNSTKATQLAISSVSINDLIDNSLQFAKDRIELNGIKVMKDYSDDLCKIEVDEEKLQIAFLNIIVNAIEAMEPFHGILSIRTYMREGKCVASFSDTGKGMSREQVDKIYEPYYTTKENGNGLGLTNTQNIILSHKAHLQVESHVGKGTTFTVYLNVA